MHSIAIPTRNRYNALKLSEKEALLKEIGALHNAVWLGMDKFSRWGQSLTTAVFQINNIEFIFIPGDTVTLGWNGFEIQSDDPDRTAALTAFQSAMRQDFENLHNTSCSPDQIENTLRSLTTPRRQAEIPPMLVEREAHPFEDGTPVSLDEITLSDSEQKTLDNFLTSSSQSLTMDSFEPGNPKLRFTKQKDGLLTEVIYPASIEQLQARLERNGMTLPSLDQWEYLCGGGCRTLFPWGDTLEFCNGASWKQQPNFFGLTISFHPYRSEIVNDKNCWLKGADGGNMECIGRFQVLNDLPASPYFAGWLPPEEAAELLEDGLSSQYDYYRHIILL